MISPYLGQQPIDDFGLNFPTLKYSAMLAASTDTTLTIPGNAHRYKAVIHTLPGVGLIFMALNQPAEMPAGASILPTTSELVHTIGSCREVKAGDVLHFITPNNGTPLSIVLYGLSTNN